MKITLLTPAKINLSLAVGEALQNGYHEIDTLMQAVSLFDEVSIETIDTGIEVNVSGAFAEGVPCGERNSCYKAAEAFFASKKLTGGIRIDIKKNIPHGAGLGGGSSDAAAVIAGLAELFMIESAVGQGLSAGEYFRMNRSVSDTYDSGKLAAFLELICCSVGADVPFFIRGGLRRCTGIGMDLFDAEFDWVLPGGDGTPLSRPRIIIAMGKETVSTAAAYALLDQKRQGEHTDISACKPFFNSFDEVITNAEIGRIKEIMKEGGAAVSSLCGSGSAVYGIFSDIKSFFGTKKILREQGFFTEVCEPVPYGSKITWAQI
jgi:4-diphosphocytidyl-2-C-methyl-D-erythritol kinase